MRTILLVIFFFAMLQNCYAAECGEAMEIAVDLKNAVQKGNGVKILDKVDEGVWFTDESASKAKFAKMLKNKKGWLYKSLFGEKKSMRQYLLNNKTDIKINYSEKSALIYYTAAGVDIALTPSITLMCSRGRWVLTGIDRFAAN